MGPARPYVFRVTRSLLVVLVLSTLATIAACDAQPDGPDGSTSSDSSGEVDASTGDAPGSTGDAGESSSSSSTGGDVEQLCFGDDCTVSCGPDLVCTPHPDNASRPVCAAPDLCTVEGVGSACAVDIEGCDGPVIGECRASSLWSALCFPIL